jgi:hypothetical protein
MRYRCPIDDCVFDTIYLQGAPSMNGHPECPGPACREEFDGFPGAGPVTPLYQPAAKPGAPGASAQQGPQQSWEEMRAAKVAPAAAAPSAVPAAAAPASVVQAPPVPQVPSW